tara:strand:- start:137 stop:928 length:792 start_codon:yes stop_codon:yes gene_type:complete
VVDKMDHKDIYHQKIESYSEMMKEWMKRNIHNENIKTISHLEVSLKNKSIEMMTNDLIWYSIFWENNLDESISLQLQNTCTHWSKLPKKYQDILDCYYPNTEIVDYCFQYQTSYHLFCIHSEIPLSLSEEALLFKALPTLKYHIYKIKKDNKNKYKLPIRDKNIFKLNKLDKEEPEKIKNKEKRYRFGDINLTALEIKYMLCLISLMSQKEIAYHHKVSETSVRKIIINVKKKYGNEHMSNSKLFTELRKSGVTLTYLDHLLP